MLICDRDSPICRSVCYFSSSNHICIRRYAFHAIQIYYLVDAQRFHLRVIAIGYGIRSECAFFLFLYMLFPSVSVKKNHRIIEMAHLRADVPIFLYRYVTDPLDRLSISNDGYLYGRLGNATVFRCIPHTASEIHKNQIDCFNQTGVIWHNMDSSWYKIETYDFPTRKEDSIKCVDQLSNGDIAVVQVYTGYHETCAVYIHSMRTKTWKEIFLKHVSAGTRQLGYFKLLPEWSGCKFAFIDDKLIVCGIGLMIDIYSLETGMAICPEKEFELVPDTSSHFVLKLRTNTRLKEIVILWREVENYDNEDVNSIETDVTWITVICAINYTILRSFKVDASIQKMIRVSDALIAIDAHSNIVMMKNVMENTHHRVIFMSPDGKINSDKTVARHNYIAPSIDEDRSYDLKSMAVDENGRIVFSDESGCDALFMLC
jgi:hypothetical protein